MLSTSRAKAWPSALLLAVLAAALYGINLGRLPHPDELYHLLAAEGMVTTGEPAIGEGGRYWRGYPFTWLVAQSIGLFGVSLSAGRLPAVLFMVATVVVLFLFIRREAGPLAAWIGGLLFAASPFAVDMAQFIRFYSLQCLTFLVGAWIVYELARVEWRWWRHLPWAIAAFGLLAFAAYLQPTTLLGLVGLGAWLGVVVLLRLHRSTLPGLRKGLILGALALVAVLALTGLAASGLLGRLWHDFRWAPLFIESRRDQFWYYFLMYFLLYPTLWTLMGIIVLLALRRNITLTIFLLMIFTIGFILNSLAGPKNTRYIDYAQPFLFALWGVGIASFVELGRGMLARVLADLRHSLTTAMRREWRFPSVALVVLGVSSVVLANPAWLRTVTLLADVTLPTQTLPTDWQAAQPVLQPWLDSADIVVTTEELGPLFYYGRADLMLSATKFAELPAERRRPFAADFRTGVPTIETADDLRRVMDCTATGLFLTQAKHWGPRAERLRDPAVEELVLERARQLDVPQRSQVVAFVWQNPAPTTDDPACARLPAP